MFNRNSVSEYKQSRQEHRANSIKKHFIHFITCLVKGREARLTKLNQNDLVYRPLQLAYRRQYFQTNLVIAQIYSWWVLSLLYKFYKRIVRFLFKTTELYRVCDAVVLTQDLSQHNHNSEGNPLDLATTASLKVSLDIELLSRVEMILLYSKVLYAARRTLESKVSEFEEPLNDILKVKGFPLHGNIQTPHAIVLRACLAKIYGTFTLMHELNARSTTRYDASVLSNEKKLMELWSQLMPDEPLGTRYTSQWQKVGFQGKDPATDFRGMGMLALDDLVWFSKFHPVETQRVLAASHHAESWFSFAIVGINMTAYCLRLVRTRHLQRHFYEFGATKDVYHEVYCYLFDEFEKFWTSQKTPTVLQFNSLFKQFQVKIERQINEQVPLVFATNKSD